MCEPEKAFYELHSHCNSSEKSLQPFRVRTSMETLVINSCLKLTHVYPKVKTGKMMKVGRRHWRKDAEWQWRTQKLFMEGFIQWHMVVICI